MNKIILKGRLTANPELKKTPSEISVCDFTIAINRRFDKEKTDFINCQAWRNTAEFITKYFSKGKEILVVGELHIDKYEKDGEHKQFTRVVVDEIEFCGNKTETQSPLEIEFEEIKTDDLPF